MYKIIGTLVRTKIIWQYVMRCATERKESEMIGEQVDSETKWRESTGKRKKIRVWTGL